MKFGELLAEVKRPVPLAGEDNADDDLDVVVSMNGVEYDVSGVYVPVSRANRPLKVVIYAEPLSTPEGRDE
jgi:hypothetical protein